MALQMSWQPSLQRRKAPPLGLRNLGNTCYLNSVLQCLTYTPPLANFCLRSQHSRLCKKLDGASAGEDRKRECPFCILEKRIARSLSIDGPYDAPAKIGSCLRLFAEHFQWGRQEDAHEFLRFVIDACHNTCVKLVKAAGGGGAGAGRGNGEPNSVVREIFGGAILSQVKCLACNTDSNKTDEIMDISLDLCQSNSLRDALRRFFQPEILDGCNKYNCSNCKELCEARKQMFILRAPNVLVIQLKRFEGMYGSKINKDVAFEEVLVLSSFMCRATQDPQLEYNLFGSIVHSGYSPESGHYYAYIKDPAGRWYCCNDASVSLSNSQEVLSEKVYILFYLRSNQKPKPMKYSSTCNGPNSLESNGNTQLNQKPPVSLKQPGGKQNGALHVENCKPAMSKFPNVNGSSNTSGHNSISPLKSSMTKLNQSLPPEKDMKILKNNKTLPRPTINFSLKNVEKRDTCRNLNGKLKVNGGEVTDINSSSEQSKHVHDQNILAQPNGRIAPANGKEKQNGSSNLFTGDCSSDPVDNGAKSILIQSNGNGYIESDKSRVHLNDDMPKMSPLMNGADASRDLVKDQCVSGFYSNKRKTGSTVGASSPAHSVCKINRNKYSPGGLEKYKDMIACEASSKLRSSGWVDEVHNFMRAKKRLCAEADDNHLDKTELKELLIADARRRCTSKIPNSVRQNLIDSLKSLSQRKAPPGINQI